MKRSNQSGSHVVGIALALFAVGVMGFAGYRVWQMQQPSDTATNSTSSTSTIPATIKTSADLSAAAKALDDSSAQLDSGLNSSLLDADINSML